MIKFVPLSGVVGEAELEEERSIVRKCRRRQQCFDCGSRQLAEHRLDTARLGLGDVDAVHVALKS